MEGDGAVLFFSRALSDGVWGESLGYTTELGMTGRARMYSGICRCIYMYLCSLNIVCVYCTKAVRTAQIIVKAV